MSSSASSYHYPTPAIADVWDRVISGICNCVCVRACVWPCCKRKVARVISTKLAHTLWQDLGMHWTGGQMVRGQGHPDENDHGHTVASEVCCWNRVLL